jgi:ribulose-phosphate 3-epimerase
MQAFVSLWSADLLDLARAVDELEELADGFHIDVFDGHNVPELLFGPDLVTALRRRTSRVIDVHLNVTDPDFWIDRFADAGADVITVQSGATRDVDATLGRIRGHGCGAGLGVEVHESPRTVVPHLNDLNRVLLMGTEIGVKGKDLDPRTPARLAELVSARGNTESSVSLIVDGGIRRHTVRALAAAGADGVIPGSLIFSSPDPRQALSELKAIPTGRDLDSRAEDWTTREESH